MLCIYIIPLILLGYQAHGAVIQNDSDLDLIDISGRLVKLIEKKCHKNSNEETYHQILGELVNLRDDCWNSILPYNKKSEEHLTEDCRQSRPKVVECLTQFGEKLKPCLGSDEKYIQQFILDSYEKYSDYFCEHIKTISFSEIMRTNTANCIQKFVGNDEVNPHKVCYAKSKVFGDNSPVDVITKQELCSDLQNIRSCYATMFDEQCPDAPEAKEFQLGIMEGGLEPCQDILKNDI